MRPLICLLALLGYSYGQYTSDVQDYTNNLPSTVCSAGFDCVSNKICIDGVIDVTGVGLLQQRMKKTTCSLPDVCCGIPGYDPPVDIVEPVDPIDPIDPVEPSNPQCHENEDCVAAEICSKDGIIDVTGGNLIDKRSNLPPPTCTNHKFPNLVSVCCLKPYVCPSKQTCVHKNECTKDGFIDRSGSFTEYFEKGIPCIDDGAQIEEGVCCTEPDIIDNIYKAAPTCGIRNDNVASDYVPSGYAKEDALFGEIPWMAIIFRQPPVDNPDQLLFQCGGVLISDRHVLTAGHCVFGLSPDEIGVRLGEWEVNSVKEPLPYSDYAVSQVSVHPEYRHTLNNIALLELAKPVAFQYHINTVCLSKDVKFSGYCIASGWGKDSFEGNYQHILKKVELPWVKRKRCQNLLRKTELSRYFRLHKSLSCAGGDVGRDTCTGDGGGPLVCQDSASGQYYLAGLVNAGLQCGRVNVPGLYVNVQYLSDWIDRTISSFGHEIGGPSYGK